MTQIFVRVNNLQAVLQALESGDDTLSDELVLGMRQTLEVGRSFLAKYPPQRLGSTYRRTGTLGRNWITEIETGRHISGLIGNRTPYAPDVQDRERQAEVHKGRWQTVQELAEKPQIENIARPIQDAVNRWAKRMNKV